MHFCPPLYVARVRSLTRVWGAICTIEPRIELAMLGIERLKSQLNMKQHVELFQHKVQLAKRSSPQYRLQSTIMGFTRYNYEVYTV
jgi:hypothetical protein